MTLPLQRLREEVSSLVKLSDDKQTGQELTECNRRLAELREAIAIFLRHDSADYVYWVERSGKGQRTVSLNAAPIDVSAFCAKNF